MSNFRSFARRDGMALATAIFVIVILGTIISGVLFASIQEHRIGHSTLYQERALAAAEYGQNAALSNWNRDTAWAMTAGAVRTRTYNLASGGMANVTTTKLNATKFLVVSEGFAGPTQQLRARRRTGQLLVLDIPQLRVPAALTSRGRDTVGGNSSTSGGDKNPTGWDCPPPGDTASAIATPDSLMTYQGASFSLTGNPPVKRDPAAADTNSYFNLGGTTYPELVSGAEKSYSTPTSTTTTVNGINPSTALGTCATGDPKNWGDPWRLAIPGLCESYMPIIHSSGGGTFALQGGGGGGRAQGILLVDGDLAISGNMEFHGLIIVRGRISVTGTGVKIFGAVMAANMNGSANRIAGTSTIQFSRCALTTILSKRSWPKPAKERAWADMF